LSASLDHAQRILSAALAAGFRESGAVSLGSTKTGESNPMIAVRSAGYSFDSIIGYQDGYGHNIAMVDGKYLRTLVNIANERFKINLDRIARFRKALLESYHPETSNTAGLTKPEWEDADARKRRKREEGLARQQALQHEGSPQSKDISDATAVENINGMFS
jgi:tRNA wybutosine-synthesizing protein 3